MANKATKNTEVNAEVENKMVEEPVVEAVVEKVEEKAAAAPKKIIIARKPTAFRKFPTMLKQHEVRTMPVGTAFEIVSEVKNGAGTFYQLKNGLYVSAAGDYSITNQ